MTSKEKKSKTSKSEPSAMRYKTRKPRKNDEILFREEVRKRGKGRRDQNKNSR
jgi:hypothetical protein